MIQKYDFVTGIQTASPPSSVTAASAIGDLFSLGYQNQFTIVNNQGAAANVTSAVWDKASYKAIYLQITIYRSASGGSTRAQAGFLILVNDGTNWEASQMGQGTVPNTGDPGIDFSVTSAGQLQYTSDDNGGVYSSTNSWLKWKVIDLVAA